jgi:hypothetical protein
MQTINYIAILQVNKINIFFLSTPSYGGQMYSKHIDLVDTVAFISLL